MKIKVIDTKLNRSQEIDIDFDANFIADKHSLLRYIKVYLNNQHQWTSNTKTRAEVSGGGKKPWKQKGTGRARSGSIRSPLWVGGGIAHGPRAKFVPLSVSKTVAQNAFLTALQQVLVNQKILGLDLSTLDKPSTKITNKILNSIMKDGKFVYVHNSNKVGNFSFRNLKNIDVKDVKNLNAYDLVNTDYVLVDLNAVEVLNSRISN